MSLKLTNTIILFGIFLVSFLLKINLIDQRPLCLDEPYTLFHAQQSLAHIIDLSIEREPTPPLFMLLTHLWSKIIGIDTFLIRLLPAFISSFTPVFLFATLKKIDGIITGLLAATLILLNDIHLYFGFELRAYGLMSMLTASTIYFLTNLILENDKKWLPGLIVSMTFLVYTNYFGWLINGSLLLFSFILFFKNHFLRKNLVIAAVITFLLFSPLLKIIIDRFLGASEGTWVPTPSINTFWNIFYQFFNSRLTFRYILAISIGLVLLSLIKTKFRKIGLRKTKIFVLFFLTFLAPFGTMYLASFKMPMFIDRYVLFCSIPLYVSLAIFSSISVSSKFIKSLQLIFTFVVLVLSYKPLSKNFYYREVGDAVNCVKSYNCPVYIYPKWNNITFSYHYDKKIFKDYHNFDSSLTSKNIHPIWGASMLSKVDIEKNLTLFINGQSTSKEYHEIRKKLKHLGFTLKDSTFFPQTIHVLHFDKP